MMNRRIAREWRNREATTGRISLNRSIPRATESLMNPRGQESIRFIDLFCGIGGFRLGIECAAHRLGVPIECVFSSDIDPACQKAYAANFGDTPRGDIQEIPSASIPDHDVLLAGFPCQPFSIIGHRKGFEDARGTLFFEIARILEAKKPQAFVLENVKLLAGHNQGRTLRRILEVLAGLEYCVSWKVLNALDFGLPQKRERLFIVGARSNLRFEWPVGGTPMRPLREILETHVPSEYFASEYIKKRRLARLSPTKEPTIWHENKAGHISAYPYSCALRAGASYNYLLVNGERRLTPREMLRLQGFPDSFKNACNYGQIRKQVGNSLPVPVAEAVLTQVFLCNGWTNAASHDFACSKMPFFDQKMTLSKQGLKHGCKSKAKNGRKVQSSIST